MFASTLLLFVLSAGNGQVTGAPWVSHVIDDTSQGADGVRLGDLNGDGLLDIVTGWEEGGVTRAYLNPGPAGVEGNWLAVTVGRTPDVEDAVLADLDGDGRLEVVTSCEGRTRTIFVHWGPASREKLLDAAQWRTELLPPSRERMMWMFVVPADIDADGRLDLIAGGKGPEAAIGWFRSPDDPRRLDRWEWNPIGPAGWIMSLEAVDIDSDGDLDILTTDRKGSSRGCRWLENPGHSAARTERWTNHFVGGRDHEIMFLSLGRVDGDDLEDIAAATRDAGLLLFLRNSGTQPRWTEVPLAMPKGVGTGKAAAVGDIDLDGRSDLVLSCEAAAGPLSGVVWLSAPDDPHDVAWNGRDISGPPGIKFDRLELVDIDADGDLDVLACEESEPRDGHRHGLGVIWYENPIR